VCVLVCWFRLFLSKLYALLYLSISLYYYYSRDELLCSFVSISLFLFSLRLLCSAFCLFVKTHTHTQKTISRGHSQPSIFFSLAVYVFFCFLFFVVVAAAAIPNIPAQSLAVCTFLTKKQKPQNHRLSSFCIVCKCVCFRFFLSFAFSFFLVFFWLSLIHSLIHSFKWFGIFLATLKFVSFRLLCSIQFLIQFHFTCERTHNNNNKKNFFCLFF